MHLENSFDRIAAVRLAMERARADSAEIRTAVDRCLADSRLRIDLTRDLLHHTPGSADSVSR
jgi:hypothetical protein